MYSHTSSTITVLGSVGGRVRHTEDGFNVYLRGEEGNTTLLESKNEQKTRAIYRQKKEDERYQKKQREDEQKEKREKIYPGSTLTNRK